MPTVKTLKNLTFQRNGVTGVSFFHCEVTFLQECDFPGKFIVSFETANDKRVHVRSCRAVSLSQPTLPWRGDEIGDSINVWFQFRNVDSIEDGIYFWAKKQDHTPEDTEVKRMQAIAHLDLEPDYNSHDGC